MRNLKLINSIITLSLTSIVLVTSVFGWYAENNNATANGLKVNTQKAEVVGGTLNRHIATKNTDSSGNITSYSLGDDIDEKNITPAPYDQSDKRDLLIYKLDVELKTTSFKLTLSNNDETISNYINIPSGQTDQIYGTNYLSNVATFQLLTYDEENKIFTISEGATKKEVGYISDRTSKINKVTLIDKTVDSLTQTVYLLFDYSVDNIEKLNSANIGRTYDKVYFQEDLKFDLE